jgi:hypothetical protein
MILFVIWDVSLLSFWGMVSVCNAEVTVHTTCCTLDTPYLPDRLYRYAKSPCVRCTLDTPYLPDRLYRVCEKSVCSCATRVMHCIGSGKLLYIKRVRWHKWPMSHSHGRYFQHFTASESTVTLSVFYIIPDLHRLRWSSGSVLAFGTQVRGFTPGRNRRIFRGRKIPQHAFLRRRSKTVGPMSLLYGM